MPKVQRKKAIHCDRHNFSLKPRNELTHQPQLLQVSFCTQPLTPALKPSEKPPCLNGPVFNTDRNFATPTFVLTSEQNFDKLQGFRMREDHDRRMINYTDEKTELNVPKPRSKNNYCSVCHHSYGDYLEHIEGNAHKKRINASEFNQHILELTSRFQKRNPFKQRHPIRKQTNFKKSKLKIQEVDSSEIEIISNPYKKVKPNETLFIPTQQTKIGSSFPVNVDQPTIFNNRPTSPVPTPSVQDALNNFNFNINMNLYLNQLPINTMNNLNNNIPFSNQIANGVNPSGNNGLMGNNANLVGNGPVHGLTRTGSLGNNSTAGATLNSGINRSGPLFGGSMRGQGGNGFIPTSSPFSSLMDLQYQNMMMSQMNNNLAPPLFNFQNYQPTPQKQVKPLTYIIIDE